MNLRIPSLRGVIERRMLVNFRARPEAVAKLLPPPFRPKLVRGWAMVGICLIRLAAMRPRLFPSWCGVGSENAAHRIAVEWDENGVTREGVFIPRRDTSSRLQAFVGGELFSGVHHRADFVVQESADEFALAMCSHDGAAAVDVRATLAERLNANSLFASLNEASEFFARGAVGYSATCDAGCWDGLELVTQGWRIEPLAVSMVTSSCFDDREKFPANTIEFDCALLMRGIEHEWRALPRIHQMKGQP